MSDITKIVKERYGKAALRVLNGSGASCCGPSSQASSCCGPSPLVPGAVDPITANLYDDQQTGGLPAEAVLASLGCGNPTALAALHPGEVVLDLGSGGGIDVLLSAKRVGTTGKAYGLDMTDEMLALARENQAKAGVTNVEILKGTMEEIPLPDGAVDVVISNCVINLAADKDRVLREAFRVLKPGGRLAVSDVVTKGEIPAAVKKSVELWIGCIAGALDEDDYAGKLRAAGFVDVTVEPTRIYRVAEARDFLASAGIDVSAIEAEVDGKFRSAFVRAVKPAA
jgi:SAM-dependent methyltransferase